MRDGMTTLAMQQRDGKRPRIKVSVWQVWQYGKVIFEDREYQFCKTHIRVHALKHCDIKPKKK